MKKLVLKESQVPYTLTLDRDALGQHIMLTQQDGSPLGVIVPYSEYQTFRVWRQERGYQKKTATADDALQALITCGEIQLSDLDERLRMNLVPGATLEKVHDALAGVSAPIEEMLRDEREKHDACSAGKRAL